MGYIGRIPLRNIWLLMFYASDLYKHLGDRDGDIEANPDPLTDLVAEILAHRVELRRQLSTGFQPREADLKRVKGCINLLRTARRRLLDQGLVACWFDELPLDTPANHLVLAALEKMANTVDNRDLASHCGSLALRLRRAGVSGKTPTRHQITSIAAGLLLRDDAGVIAAARLAFDLAWPTEQEGRNLLPIPIREEHWARGLFERAVAGFHDVVASPSRWKVRTGRWLRWNEQAPSAGIEAILPSIKTDIFLDHESRGHRIMIDTKFTEIVSRGWHRQSTLRSRYIYQMYAYLRSQEGCGDSLADRASGLLLHPSVGTDMDESAGFQGHRIRFATVDLTAEATDIRQRLLQVIQGHCFNLVDTGIHSLSTGRLPCVPLRPIPTDLMTLGTACPSLPAASLTKINESETVPPHRAVHGVRGLRCRIGGVGHGSASSVSDGESGTSRTLAFMNAIMPQARRPC